MPQSTVRSPLNQLSGPTNEGCSAPTSRDLRDCRLGTARRAADTSGPRRHPAFKHDVRTTPGPVVIVRARRGAAARPQVPQQVEETAERATQRERGGRAAVERLSSVGPRSRPTRDARTRSLRRRRLAARRTPPPSARSVAAAAGRGPRPQEGFARASRAHLRRAIGGIRPRGRRVGQLSSTAAPRVASAPRLTGSGQRVKS